MRAVRPHDGTNRRGILARAGALSVAVLVSAACASSAPDPLPSAGPTTAATVTTTTTAPSGSTGDDRPRPSAGCAASPGRGADAGARGSHVAVNLSSGGRARTFQQYVPASYGDGPAPLVLDLHGYLSGAGVQVVMSDFARLADEHGFVLATPQGSGEIPYWNAVPHESLPDDVHFVSDVIHHVAADLCVDLDRVYVDGFSNGAFLTSLVACRLADEVAAVATVAGLMVPAGCRPSAPVPVVAFHGTDDRYVSFEGSPNAALETMDWNDETRLAFDGLAFAPVRESASWWARHDGCRPDPVEHDLSESVSTIDYRGCRDGASVRLYVVRGGGHTWPGSAFSEASKSILGETTFDVDASEAIWSFFRSHRR